MTGLQTKKIITLTVIGTYCLLSLGNFYYTHNIDSGFSSLASMIIGFYFSKNSPNNSGDGSI